MAADSSEQFVLLNQLAEEFAARFRLGERPSLQEYIDRHPELADDIREYFPALAVMEQVKDDRQAPVEQAASLALPPLERLGDFRIIREIGHGGMGVVYEAEQVSLGRHVALKVLPQQRLVSPQTKQRFEREAKAAARLHHTNIVPVFGVGEHEGLPYYVMQFIPGLGLDEVLEELQRLQPGKPGSSSLPVLTGGELRVSRKDVSAAAVARSLLTGRFTPTAEQKDDAPPPRIDPTVAETPGAAASSPEADAAGSPNETPVAGRLSDAFSLSSSSVVLPGTGRQAGQKQLTYWQSVARIGFQVADALEYAHRQGILHRDIKPSNLLLDTTGTVWVTDFGLAKADDQQNLTHTGDILGTLRYMPPEAFDGKTDARGDVYSLGLTLYELLVFRPAFDEKERNRLIKHVTTAEPARLDRLNRALPRDLVTIVHKAISKEQGRRYQTARDLAADLQRFLDDQPILARRSSSTERAWRWCRRNPLPASLLAGIVLVFLAGFAGVFWQWREAETAREVEKYQRDRAEARQKGAETDRDEAEQACAVSDKSRAAAQAETYRAMLSEVRALRAGHLPDWRRMALDDLARLALMPTPRRDLAELRTEAAAVLGTPDIRLVAKIKLPADDLGAFAFSPDGRTLLTAGRKSGLDFWDVPGQRHLSSVEGLTVGKSTAGTALYLPDGQGLAVGTHDHGVVFTDMQGIRTTRAPITQGSSRPAKLAISANGERIAVAWDGGGITVHDTASGALLAKFKGSHFALSPDGRWLVRLENSELVLLPITSDEPRIVLGRYVGVGANALAFSPDGTRLAVAFYKQATSAEEPEELNDPGKVVLWDVVKREQLGTLLGHRERILDLAFSPDGEWIATGSLDYTARIWDPRTGQNVTTLSGSSSPAFGVKWSPTGDFLAVGMNNSHEVFLYAIAGRHTVQQWLIGHRVELLCVAAHPRLDRLATSGYKELNTWDLSVSPPSPVAIGPNPGAVTSLAYSPDGSLLATASWHGSNPREIVIRDANTGKVQSRISWPQNVTALAFDPTGERLAGGDVAGNVVLWDLATSLPVQQFATGSEVHSVIFLDHPRSLVTHGKDAVLLFNLESGKLERKVPLAGGGIRKLVADRACSRLVVGFQSGAISGLSLPDLTPGLRLEGAHDGKVDCLALSPDGHLLATGGADHRVVLRDALSFQALLAFPLWAGTPRHLTFDSRGRRLAVVGTVSDVDLWDLVALHDGLTAIGLAWDQPAAVVPASDLAPEGERLRPPVPIIRRPETGLAPP